jgi:hypothetical protein
MTNLAQYGHRSTRWAQRLNCSRYHSDGCNAEEPAEAHAWITNEALLNPGRPPLPTGRIGRLVELIKERDEEQERE